MSNHYCIVAGKASDAFKDIFNKKMGDVALCTDTCGNVRDLAKRILDNSGNNLLDLKSVVVLDYSYDDDPEILETVDGGKDVGSVVDSILYLENVCTANHVSGTKLYVLTKMSNVYYQLKQGADGMSATTYPDTHILLFQNEITDELVKEILLGKYDHEGIYREHRLDTMTQGEKLTQQGEDMIKHTQLVDKSIRNYGDETPVSDLRKRDFVDSKVTKSEYAKRKREQEKQARDREHLKRTGRLVDPPKVAEDEPKPSLSKDDMNLGAYDRRGAVPSKRIIGDNGRVVKTVPQARKVPPVNIQRDIGGVMPLGNADNLQGGSSQPTLPNSNEVSPNVGALSNAGLPETAGKAPIKGQSVYDAKVATNYRREPTANEKRLAVEYVNLRGRSDNIDQLKLEGDQGVISFTGAKGVGCSGLVAQIAELYASSNRTVLIIDLDTVYRGQTRYFNGFDTNSKLGGNRNGLAKIPLGLEVKRLAVKVTPKISMISSVRGDFIDGKTERSIRFYLRHLAEQAKSVYDIILLDIPLERLDIYATSLAGLVDRNVFVISNTVTSFEDTFPVQVDSMLKAYGTEMVRLLSKSAVVLNRCLRGRRDDNGVEFNAVYVSDLLRGAGNPYDKLNILGELPEFDDWAVQLLTNTRYIYKDSVGNRGLIAMYRRIVSNLLI